MENIWDSFFRTRPNFIGAPPSFWNLLVALVHDEAHQIALTHANLTEDQALQVAIAECRTRLILGNRLKYILIGGARSNSEVRSTLAKIFQVPIIDGYATTETGTIFTNHGLASGLEVKLLDIPELGYVSSNTPAQGEICVWSSRNSLGYFNKPELTQESFVTFEGKLFFRTGDIGQQSASGEFSIIDRIKSIIKLPHGEFISPELLENIYESDPRVEQIYIWANGLADVCVAVVVIAPSFTQANESSVLEMLRNIGSDRKLRACEIPQAVLIEHQPFPAELFSSSGKRKRLIFQKYYQPQLDQLYARLETSNRVLSPSKSFTLVPKLYELFMQVLSMDENLEFDPSVSFLSLGGNSVSMTRFVALLDRTLGVSCNMSELLQTKSFLEIERLVFERLENNPRTSIIAKRISWPDECHLSQEFLTLVEQDRETFRNSFSSETILSYSQRADVLLTGANGFLGCFLLQELLKMSNAKIICIVRASSTQAAWEKLETQCREMNCWPENTDRIKILTGDVSKPYLGIDPLQFFKLCARVESLYHNAAQVHGMLSYEQLKSSNVDGTREMIRLALCGRRKHFHYISSVNVLRPPDAHPESTVALEHFQTMAATMPGYAQTKTVCELLLENAFTKFSFSEQGFLSLSFSRPSTICGHSEHGASNKNCFTNQVICGLIDLGVYPDFHMPFIPKNFLFTPVDYVASSIVHLTRALEIQQNSDLANFQIFHLVPRKGLSWRRTLDYITSYGFSLNPVNESQWNSLIANIPESNRLFVFKDQLRHSSTPTQSDLPKKNSLSLCPDSRNTSTLLSKYAPNVPNSSPDISEAMFHRILYSLKLMGLIRVVPKPTAQPKSVSELQTLIENPYYRFENWYPDLQELTFPSSWFELNEFQGRALRELRKSLLHFRAKAEEAETNIFNKNVVRSFTMEISDVGVTNSGSTGHRYALVSTSKASHNYSFTHENQVLSNILREWKDSAPEYFHQIHAFESQLESFIHALGNNCFLKLSSRSPKDSKARLENLNETLSSLGLHKDHLSTPEASVKLLKAECSSLRVINARQGLLLFLDSSRIEEDLTSCELLHQYPLQCIVRKFVTIEPHLEFRLFVFSGKLNCASVYHKHCFIPFIVEHQTTIQKKLIEYWQLISEKITASHYALDIVFSTDLQSIRVVELNFPPPIASGILFNWYEPKDREIMICGPFELRIVSEERLY
jgi:thioester reductase-like protein